MTPDIFITIVNWWLERNGYQPVMEHEKEELLKQKIKNLKNEMKNDRIMRCLDGYGELICERYPHIKFECPNDTTELDTDFICHLIFLLFTLRQIPAPGRFHRFMMKTGNHGICM